MIKKKLKVNITRAELEMFPFETLKIEEYWKSLYEDCECKKSCKHVIYKGAK